MSLLRRLSTVPAVERFVSAVRARTTSVSTRVQAAVAQRRPQLAPSRQADVLVPPTVKRVVAEPPKSPARAATPAVANPDAPWHHLNLASDGALPASIEI